MIDTHVLVWYLVGSDRLSEELKQEIDEVRRTGGRILVSTIVLSEALYIAESGRSVDQDMDERLAFDALYERISEGTGFEIVGFGRGVLEEAVGIQDIPELHDRIIAATAKFYGAEVLTDDPEILTDDPEIGSSRS